MRIDASFARIPLIDRRNAGLLAKIYAIDGYSLNKKLVFVVNDFGFFISHRLPIALKARDEGFQVWVAAPAPAGLPQTLINLGLNVVLVPLSRRGLNPLAELQALWALFRLFQRLKPDLVHLVTIKPVLYGGMAARLAGVPAVVSAVSGLGTLFTRRVSLLTRVAQAMYKLALGHKNQAVILQNTDDLQALVREGGLDPAKAVLIRGSGADLRTFMYAPERDGVPVVVMAARLLRDKGLIEYLNAAKLLVERHAVARFLAVGEPDPGNPSSISEAEWDALRREGVVEFPGFCADIAQLFAHSHVVVLPSYREGLPKVLIEAAACGRAVVTTDVTGCRDAIETGVTGLLVPLQDAHALADAIQFLLEHPARRQEMGRAGRALAERTFSIEGVVNEHIVIYQCLLKRAK